jgi:hypothetical protein
MNQWFNLQDVHRDKHMQERFSSYRNRIARTHAQHVRHLDLPRGNSAGRPQRVTLITPQGIDLLYAPQETLPTLKPYPTPMRLTDKARRHIIEGGLDITFSTAGTEQPARVLDRERFIAYLVSIGNDDLVEPDFLNL